MEGDGGILLSNHCEGPLVRRGFPSQLDVLSSTEQGHRVRTPTLEAGASCTFFCFYMDTCYMFVYLCQGSEMNSKHFLQDGMWSKREKHACPWID